ncbi:hypothetical protein OGAPHI_001408 [Ogataea philodendri]|uniref:SAGA-associated factor 11 n=1 Tax=Ogataea philodendri TaxID=1378263 RepID=A0A9P8PC54_9ASCO|nr:uncharacterized protein OGAPHI_001408 [Ogataea philodendri]KAH3669287.1 hypothetical protein OGAPHI_001408 [Ogataea philodendri]
MSVTYSTVSISILEDMLCEITGEIISRSILEEKLLRQQFGPVQQQVFADEGETTVGTLKKLRQTAGNSDNSSTNSSALGTPQPGENGSAVDVGRVNFVRNGKDIFGKNTASGDSYFQCLNCDRKIAGGRFAAHIDKCLGGRVRK